MRSLITAILILAAAATARAEDAQQSHFLPDTGAIFPVATARDLAEQCSREAPENIEGTWTPSQKQIAALEPKLEELLAQSLAQKKQRGDRYVPAVSDYYRQYAGYVIGGRKIIYINGFDKRIVQSSAEHGLDWHVTPVRVCDGGNAFFGVEYDVEVKRFGKLAFNGLA